MTCVRSWRAVHWALKGWSHSWSLASPNSWRWRSRRRSPRSRRSLNLLVWRRMRPVEWRMTERWEKIWESCTHREPVWSIAYKHGNKYSLQEEERKRQEEQERQRRERRYVLPDEPTIIVHPNWAAKNGKFDCSIMSLSVLLDYRLEDNKEHSFEVRITAEK